MVFSQDKNWFLSVDSMQNLTLREKDCPSKILAEEVTSFDGVCRKPQKADVFYSTDRGSLVHMKFDGREISQTVLMTSKNPKRKIRFVNVIEINGRYHLFYCLDSEMRYLVHQVVSQGDSFAPEVVDNIGKRFVYSVVKDEDSNIHLVYEVDGMLKYKKYVYAEKRYTSAEKLCKANPRKLCTALWGDRIYAVFTEYVSGAYRLYLLKISGEIKNKTVMTIDKEAHISLNCGKNGIKIHVADKGICYEVESNFNLEIKKPQPIGKSYGIRRIRFCDDCSSVRLFPVNRFMLPFEGYTAFTFPPLQTTGEFVPRGAEAVNFANRYKETFGESMANLQSQDISYKLSQIEGAVKNLSEHIEKALDELKKTQTPST